MTSQGPPRTHVTPLFKEYMTFSYMIYHVITLFMCCFSCISMIFLAHKKKNMAWGGGSQRHPPALAQPRRCTLADLQLCEPECSSALRYGLDHLKFAVFPWFLQAFETQLTYLSIAKPYFLKEKYLTACGERAECLIFSLSNHFPSLRARCCWCSASSPCYA